MITTKLLLHILFFFLLNYLLVQVLGHYDQLNNTTSSSWLRKHTVSNWRKPKPPKPPKPPMCKPLACKRSGPPKARMRCCRKQCVDILSDPNHCRFCFRRCRFAWSCCGGGCVDTNNDPSNCGQCGKKCDSGAPCEFGMCGYAAPSPPPRKRRRRPKFRKPHPPPSPDSEVLNDDE